MPMECHFALVEIASVVERPSKKVGGGWVYRLCSFGSRKPLCRSGVVSIPVVGKPHQERQSAVGFSGIDSLPQSDACCSGFSRLNEAEVLRLGLGERWSG